MLAPVPSASLLLCRLLPGLIPPKVAGDMKEIKMERIKDDNGHQRHGGSATEASTEAPLQKLASTRKVSQVKGHPVGSTALA